MFYNKEKNTFLVLKRSNLMASLVDIIDTSSLPLPYSDKTSLSTLPHEFHVFDFANVNDSCSDFFEYLRTL
jgi:hypothetical protein